MKYLKLFDTYTYAYLKHLPEDSDDDYDKKVWSAKFSVASELTGIKPEDIYFFSYNDELENVADPVDKTIVNKLNQKFKDDFDFNLNIDKHIVVRNTADDDGAELDVSKLNVGIFDVVYFYESELAFITYVDTYAIHKDVAILFEKMTLEDIEKIKSFNEIEVYKKAIDIGLL